MNCRRLRSAFLAFALGSVALSGSPAQAQWTSQPIMLGDNDVSVVRGSDTWINVAWTAPTAMENFRMIVQEWQAGTETAYIAGDAAELGQDSTLEPGEIDVSRFRLSTSESTPDSFFVQVIAEWEFEGETYRYFPGGLNVSVVDFEGGEDYALLTADATVSSTGDGSSNWIELDFLGVSGEAKDLQITMSGDIEIYHPQGSFTSLHHDAWLLADERDVARVWVDPATVNPGSHVMTIEVQSTDAAGQSQANSYQFTINVV